MWFEFISRTLLALRARSFDVIIFYHTFFVCSIKERGMGMKSFVNVTDQIDDLPLAVTELLAGTSSEVLGKNTVGILLCYSDMDTTELVSALAQKASFPILGCTTIATMEGKGGFHDLAVTLTVLSSDDCSFALGVSDPITPQNVAEQIDKTCRSVCQELGEEPQLLYVLPPYILDIMLDEYAIGFNRCCPNVPLLGGLPSYNAIGDKNLTVFGGEDFPDRMVLLAVGGNLRPVFTVQNVTAVDADRKRKVTESKDNVIYRVGDQTFTDYLREVGLPVESLTQGNATITFVSNPLLLESSQDDFSFVRTLHEINLEEGSGTAIAQIPVGATMSICSLQRSEIEQAAAAGVKALKEKMAAAQSDGYQYSTVLAVSCIGRHLLMSPNNDAEVNSLLNEFPADLALSGFYSYGELGPQGATRTQNFAHNESLILCAF